MATILDTIIQEKKIEVARRKLEQPVTMLQQGKWFMDKRRSLKKLLSQGQGTGIIAEFKRKSPSKGWFKNADIKVNEIVEGYNQHGASAISILTDEPFFGGSLIDISTARAITTIPLLRKDFMIDPYQMVEAKAYGADVILLIAACLTPMQVQELAIAAHEQELEVLLEIHDSTELSHICDDVDMVGVNNRDLKTFNVDIEKSISLIKNIPATFPAVAESGIQDTAVINQLKKAGFKGFLIGENFMKADVPSDAFEKFVNSL